MPTSSRIVPFSFLASFGTLNYLDTFFSPSRDACLALLYLTVLVGTRWRLTALGLVEHLASWFLGVVYSWQDDYRWGGLAWSMDDHSGFISFGGWSL